MPSIMTPNKDETTANPADLQWLPCLAKKTALHALPGNWIFSATRDLSHFLQVVFVDSQHNGLTSSDTFYVIGCLDLAVAIEQ